MRTTQEISRRTQEGHEDETRRSKEENEKDTRRQQEGYKKINEGTQGEYDGRYKVTKTRGKNTGLSISLLITITEFYDKDT